MDMSTVSTDSTDRTNSTEEDKLSNIAESEFYQDVITGLGAAQKQLQPKYFYDALGSHYFDQICSLEEYYPYRTELELLPRVAEDLSHYFDDRSAPAINVVEFGAGSLHKIIPLLSCVESIQEFTAIDICGEHLQIACAELARHFPELDIQAVSGDFTKPMILRASSAIAMGFFPGSTIGNFTPLEAVQFLSSARDTLGIDSYMLVGVDTKKNENILNRAYNDGKGITARFNKNILRRINAELGADFELDGFSHEAFYNRKLGRVEMHLRSDRAQQVSLGRRRFFFEPGETIHTESSYKYHPEEFEQLAREAGWDTETQWLAEGNLFSASLLRARH